MRLGWRSSWSGVRTPVRLTVQGPAGEVPATAPFSSLLHHRYRRWMGGVSRPHSFFFRRYVLVLIVSGMSKWEIKKARHQAQHTCSSALRHRRPPPEPHLLLVVLFGVRPRGFEPPSSGQQPAAPPLRYKPQKPTLCLSSHRIEVSGQNFTNQRLGPRPPHTNNASQRRQEESQMLVYISTHLAAMSFQV